MSKRYYESYIIIDGNLDDAAIDEEIKKYESFFTKNEIDINNIDNIGRKRLSYPIKKKQNGFYVCFEISAPPQIITKLERTYILDENVLRYLTVYMSPKTLREKDEHLKNRAIIQSKYEETKNNLAAAAENGVLAPEASETSEVKN
ncbi:MAG: 30S ribosomal protein S6 [Ignavibacteria bacterium]